MRTNRLAVRVARAHQAAREAYAGNELLRRSRTLGAVHGLLRTGDIDSRRLTVWFLGALGDARSAPALIGAYYLESDPYFQGSCLDALGHVGGKLATSFLVDRIRNALTIVERERSASGLRWVRTTTTVCRALVESLGDIDEDSSVREMAADSLGHHRPDQAVPTLLRAVGDRHPNVRYWSIVSLGRTSERTVIPELMAMAEMDTDLVYEPDTSLLWGSVSSVAAESAIAIKRRCGIALTQMEVDHATLARFVDS